MALIDHFMPAYDVRQVDRIAVAADVPTAYALARHMEACCVPLLGPLLLGRLFGPRPGVLPASERGPQKAATAAQRSASGFTVLAEQPGSELVTGGIAAAERGPRRRPLTHAQGFAQFAQPGFCKLAWSVRVSARPGGGASVSIDLRAAATDATSVERLRRYFALGGSLSRAIRRAALRVLQFELGRVAADHGARSLPGDELMIRARWQRTHAVVVEAPPDRVWDWVVQVQHAARAAGRQSLCVLRIEHQRLLVLGTPGLCVGAREGARRWPWRSSWAFLLEPFGGATRLLVRLRADYDPERVARPISALFGPVYEVMERGQLRRIKRYVEVPSPS